MRTIDKLLPVECYSTAREWRRPRALLKVRFIVQHSFSAMYVRPEAPYNLEYCWQLFHDLNFEPEDRKFAIYSGPRVPASTHFLIDRHGAAYLLVPLEYQAWHAGTSEWRGVRHLNAWSIAIENLGQYGEPYTDEQYRTNAGICAELMAMHGLGSGDIVGHEQVAMPRGRKKDPGPTFEWHKLQRYITSPEATPMQRYIPDVGH